MRLSAGQRRILWQMGKGERLVQLPHEGRTVFKEMPCVTVYYSTVKRLLGLAVIEYEPDGRNESYQLTALGRDVAARMRKEPKPYNCCRKTGEPRQHCAFCGTEEGKASGCFHPPKVHLVRCVCGGMHYACVRCQKTRRKAVGVIPFLQPGVGPCPDSKGEGDAKNSADAPTALPITG